MFQFEPNPTRNASTMFFVDTIYFTTDKKIDFCLLGIGKTFLQYAVKINR